MRKLKCLTAILLMGILLISMALPVSAGEMTDGDFGVPVSGPIGTGNEETGDSVDQGDHNEEAQLPQQEETQPPGQGDEEAVQPEDGETGITQPAEGEIENQLPNPDNAEQEKQTEPKQTDEAVLPASEGSSNIITYHTHVQTYGWQDWAADGAMSGTSGEAKRLEAIQIELTGEMAEHYDIFYRVHAQTFGWMGWAKNGAQAGTAGYAKRLEGIEIVLVEKDGAAPGSTENAFKHPYIQYQTHVQTYGWQGWKYDGAMSGTSGQAKRLEGIEIQLLNQEYEGGVRYRTQVQTYGWQGWKANGEMSGTSGQAKRLEAIQIELTGEMAEHYDIYYRVHAQTFGWLSWVKNGEQSGTVGYAKRLEGIEIQLIPKGGQPPAQTREQPAIAGTKIAQKTNQIVAVNARGSSSATVQLWEKQGIDWLKVMETKGYVGSQGVGKASASVSRTPAGAYTLGFAFGTGGNPGTKLDYRQITKNSYWIGNVNDPQYNTWQERESSSKQDEHLMDYPVQYEFAITLDYNNGIGGGSAFFLHVSNGRPTAGCIAVPRSEMLFLMQKIQKGAYIVNVNSENELLNY